MAFGPPESLPGWPGEVLRPGRYNRRITNDLSTGRVCLAITTDSGQTRDTRHGLITDTIAEEIWSIHPDDPLSARAVIDWTQHYSRADLRIEIKTGATMTSDKDSFFLTGYIRAEQNGEQVFEKQFDETIARDHR